MIAIALAVFALMLQSLAPVVIAPPRGQPVHFAHTHQAEPADHGAHAAHSQAPAQPEDFACPVCKSLAAAGFGIAALPPALGIAQTAIAAPGVMPEAAAPCRLAANAHRARAPPPMSA